MRYSARTRKRLLAKRLPTDSWGSNCCFPSAHTVSTQDCLSSSHVFLPQSGWLCCVIHSRLEGALSPQARAAFTLSPTTLTAQTLHRHVGSIEGLQLSPRWASRVMWLAELAARVQPRPNNTDNAFTNSECVRGYVAQSL